MIPQTGKPEEKKFPQHKKEKVIKQNNTKTSSCGSLKASTVSFRYLEIWKNYYSLTQNPKIWELSETRIYKETISFARKTWQGLQF